jgi:hypothetical protein
MPRDITRAIGGISRQDGNSLGIGGDSRGAVAGFLEQPDELLAELSLGLED